ncbi:Flagellar motor rotation protein MotB [uncultured Alphaproteobacteria bacterium]|uniref:Flagellar motor rotation protein MotB n=1 Tax=uncultured Alphaproteobacteria bacterium TaxID=91750 RepID=A0A212J2W6_9PROT|nr:Flagellar motor rotation protein MotB [uncultured Alphaproteobacteria bacterium]
MIIPTRRPPQSNDEDWMTTYADMVTLLLGFFILLASISKVDMALFEQVQAGMAKGVGKRDIETPLENLKREVKEILVEMNVDETSSIGSDSSGVIIEFASSSFFDPGSAVLRDTAKPILSRVADTLNADIYKNFQVEVQGHTDDTPIHNAQFPSNWELSAARATGVVRYFLEQKMVPARLRAVGLADVAPKVPNLDPFGNPLPQNREINRRIVIRVNPDRLR